MLFTGGRQCCVQCVGQSKQLCALVGSSDKVGCTRVSGPAVCCAAVTVCTVSHCHNHKQGVLKALIPLMVSLLPTTPPRAPTPRPTQPQPSLPACPPLHPPPHSTWLDAWRKHLHAALGKKLVVPALLPPAPEPLPQAIRALMCRCHPPETPLLAVQLPQVVNKRGR
jgi:hypothetical protein